MSRSVALLAGRLRTEAVYTAWFTRRCEIPAILQDHGSAYVCQVDTAGVERMRKESLCATALKGLGKD